MDILGSVRRSLQRFKQRFNKAAEALPAGESPASDPRKTVRHRTIRFRLSTGRGIRGPAMLPKITTGSRQVRRAALRAAMFARATAMYPLMSRRDRRRYASLSARIMFRGEQVTPTGEAIAA